MNANNPHTRCLLALLTVALLSGCTNFHSKIGWARPASTVMELDFGPENFRKGYKDGCSSGYSGYANSFNKMFHEWKQDPHLISDPVYYQIWKDAYSYCGYMAMTHDEHGLGNWR